eukprot:COSAG05_NODE_604_length_8399_cov_6.936145_10_plen_99_part_00
MAVGWITGSGAHRPKPRDTCSIALVVTHESTGQRLFVYGTTDEPAPYTAGETGPAGLLPGLDTLLSIMREGETSAFRLAHPLIAIEVPMPRATHPFRA